MSRMVRALQIVFLLSLLLSVGLGIAATRHSLPPAKLLGVLFFAFLILAYVVVWYSIRNRTAEPGGPPATFKQTPERNFMAAASLRGWLCVFSGAGAILVGLLVPSDKTPFLIAGAASCCIGFYFVSVGWKSRRRP